MQLSSVTVEVPTDRLADFYTTLAGLFESEKVRLTDWERSDTAIAKKVYESLSPVAREIYDYLIETADEGFTIEELALKTGKNPSQIRGALSWPSSHAKSFGKVPIHAQNSEGKVFVYGKVAEIFQAALMPVEAPKPPDIATEALKSIGREESYRRVKPPKHP